MNYIFLIVITLTYLLAFSVNLMPAIKYPDININVYNLLVTILFLLVLLIYSKNKSVSKIRNKILRIFSIVGVVSGVLIFIIKTFEDAMFNHVILDAIASLQYPFYLVFTTPLFGVNIFFDLSYAAFSLLMSLFYILVFILAYSSKKNAVK